jgi:hypothetical protein
VLAVLKHRRITIFVALYDDFDDVLELLEEIEDLDYCFVHVTEYWKTTLCESLQEYGCFLSL